MADPNDVGIDYDPEEDPPAMRAERVRRTIESDLLKVPGVKGTGIGRDAAGNDTIIVYVGDGSVSAALPKRIEGIAVQIEITGDIDALR